MEKVLRLTIEDFKLKKLENKSEIEKLIGGVAAGCHVYTTGVGGLTPETSPIQFVDDDCSKA